MRNTTEKYLLFLVLIVTLLGGCVAITVKQATIRETIDVPTGVDEKPLLFKKIVVKLARGKKIGSTQVGLLCIPSAPLTWHGGTVTLSRDEFTEIFREELEKTNYPLVGNRNALFEDPGEWKAELLVAGLVKEMAANICYPMAGFRDHTTSKGEVFILVEWRIFSRLDRNVVYTTTTENSSKLKQSSPTGNCDIFLDAFDMATQNLLADRGFHDLVVRADSQKSEPSEKLISNTKSMPFQREIGENINAVRAGVVTSFAGDGHGSGFVIDNSGLMLTNTHFVGVKKLVTVKLVTVREILGEMLRSNSRRDAALVKVEESKLTSLPVRVTDVNIGEELYAILSPLDEKWSATMSKGIVSSHQAKDGMEYVQLNIRMADTTTNHIPYSVHSCDQNAFSLLKVRVVQEQHRVDEADRLKFFLFLYCHTYESKDIDKFATFFAHDALENNKPFHELLPKYRRNMEMIESLDYRIELVSYSLQASTGNITLQGKFYIRYLLHGGTWKEKSGNISMELTKRGISYLVKRLNYGN